MTTKSYNDMTEIEQNGYSQGLLNIPHTECSLKVGSKNWREWMKGYNQGISRITMMIVDGEVDDGYMGLWLYPAIKEEPPILKELERLLGLN